MKRASKLTPWFPMSTPPARPGSYEVGTRVGSAMQPLTFPFHWFDGEKWFGADGQPTPKRADEDGWPVGSFYMDGAFWRGLAEQPK